MNTENNNDLKVNSPSNLKTFKNIDLAIWAKSKGKDNISRLPDGSDHDYKYQYRILLFYRYWLKNGVQLSIENARAFVTYLDHEGFSGRFIEYYIKTYKEVVNDLIQELTGISKYWTGVFIGDTNELNLINLCQIIRKELFSDHCFVYCNPDDYIRFNKEREMLYLKADYWDKRYK